MRQTILYLLAFTVSVMAARQVQAQTKTAPSIVWEKTIGGNGSDSLSALCIDKSKAIVMCGSSRSSVSGSKTQDSVGGYDYWVVKTDSSGNIIWNKTFGGTKNDIASAIIATSDGGYLVGGTSISDLSGSKSSNSFSSNDYWVLKLDVNGNKVWDITLGGLYTDVLTSLAELPSGNFIVGGNSFSDIYGTKTTKNIGSENTADYWVLIIDKNGTLVSQNIYGGTSDDALASVSPYGVGSIFLAGSSYSLRAAGYKSNSPIGNNDYWIVKTDLAGNNLYDAEFGGNRSDYLTCMQVLPDSSIILGGYSNSDAGSSKSSAFLGVTDFWVVKLKPNGALQWDKTIGGASGDYLTSIQQTKDKGFLLGGYSNSNTGNNKTDNSKGGFDYWMVKLDSKGNILWDKTVGGSGDDILSDAYETDSEKYVMAGTSFSPQSGDKSAGTSGGSDYWIVSLKGNSDVLPVTLVSFAASLRQQDVAINWSTANQANISRFEVERSTDGIGFYQTAVVTASSVSGSYQSIDPKAAVLPFDKLYYRLKIINNDGSFSYSNVITVQLVSLTSVDFTILPNPVKAVLILQYHTLADKKADVVVYTASGKVVLKATLSPSTGISSHTFNVASLSKGVYYVSMNTGDTNKKITRAFVKE